MSTYSRSSNDLLRVREEVTRRPENWTSI